MSTKRPLSTAEGERGIREEGGSQWCSKGNRETESTVLWLLTPESDKTFPGFSDKNKVSSPDPESSGPERQRVLDLTVT